VIEVIVFPDLHSGQVCRVGTVMVGSSLPDGLRGDLSSDGFSQPLAFGCPDVFLVEVNIRAVQQVSEPFGEVAGGGVPGLPVGDGGLADAFPFGGGGLSVRGLLLLEFADYVSRLPASRGMRFAFLLKFGRKVGHAPGDVATRFVIGHVIPIRSSAVNQGRISRPVTPARHHVQAQPNG
jgi:hypothetical protein